MLRPFGSGESGCGEVGFGLVLKLVGQGPIVTCLAWEAICRIASCSFARGLLDRVVALLGKRGRRPRVVQRVFLERFSYLVIRISQYTYNIYIYISYKHLIYTTAYHAIWQSSNLKKKTGFFSLPKTKPGIGQVVPSTLQCRWLDVVHQRHHYQDLSEPPVKGGRWFRLQPTPRPGPLPTCREMREIRVIQATKKWPQKVTVLVEMIPPKHEFEAKRWKSRIAPETQNGCFSFFGVRGEMCSFRNF